MAQLQYRQESSSHDVRRKDENVGMRNSTDLPKIMRLSGCVICFALDFIFFFSLTCDSIITNTAVLLWILNRQPLKNNKNTKKKNNLGPCLSRIYYFPLSLESCVFRTWTDTITCGEAVKRWKRQNRDIINST